MRLDRVADFEHFSCTKDDFPRPVSVYVPLVGLVYGPYIVQRPLSLATVRVRLSEYSKRDS